MEIPNNHPEAIPIKQIELTVIKHYLLCMEYLYIYIQEIYTLCLYVSSTVSLNTLSQTNTAPTTKPPQMETPLQNTQIQVRTVSFTEETGARPS